MSVTVYESPEDATDRLDVDITHATVWFFNHGKDDEIVGTATVALSELPALVKSMMEWLEGCGWVYCEKCKSWYPPDSLHARSSHPTRRPVT